jgi:uncharacterized repeat protein (TIGR03803 family)
MKYARLVCRFQPSLTLAVLAALLTISAPAQAQTELVLHNFHGNDGDGPESRLIFDNAGNLYGTTPVGGTFGYGNVFELSPKGNGKWEEKVLYSFTGGTDGANPFSDAYVLFDGAGNLYGETYNGGDLTCNAPHGCGAVFELSPAGENWTESVLYRFTGGSDGAFPLEGLIMDAAANLYGIASVPGTVFELSPSDGGWTQRVIYNFDCSDLAGLTMDASGNIFGVDFQSAFELSPDGNGGWNSSMVYSFKDDVVPDSSLVSDDAGNLYGTTYAGGGKNSGAVYELSPRKRGGWKEKTLYSFTGGHDGRAPVGIVFDASGNMYGATVSGGKFGHKFGDGTVFELISVGNGRYKQKVLWTFDSRDGRTPVASLMLDSVGNLYGTTDGGGPNDDGVVFEMTP